MRNGHFLDTIKQERELAFKNIDFNIVEFKKVQGRDVPCQPWPQSFYVSRMLIAYDSVEVRPLTITGLIKGISKNLITMSYWRLMRLIWKCGFFNTKEKVILLFYTIRNNDFMSIIRKLKNCVDESRF